MTRDDIIRMAREAGWSGIYSKPLMSITMQEDDFLRFAALVAAEALVEPCCGNYYQCQKICMPRAVAVVREAMIKDGWRQCAEGQGTTQYCKMFEDAVKRERERAWGKGFDHALDLLARYKVKKSKARSEKWK